VRLSHLFGEHPWPRCALPAAYDQKAGPRTALAFSAVAPSWRPGRRLLIGCVDGTSMKADSSILRRLIRMRRWFEALILRLSFALAEDAARFCEVVRATPDKSYGDCASMAFFNYDAGLYNELSGAFTTRGLARLKPPMREASSWSMSLVWGPAMMPAGSTTTRSRLSWPTMNSAKTSLLPSWREFVWGHREDAVTRQHAGDPNDATAPANLRKRI
jgi:hypothetical protein